MWESLIDFFVTLNFGAVFKIIMIDILLGGDNAVIIALACRDLPKHLRNKGIFWGTIGAIILRVILVFFALSLLNLPFLKLIGGLLLFWVGVKLLTQSDDSHKNISSSDKLFNAVKTILVADLVMSIDNVIGMAGAAQNADPDHQLGLIIFGLLFSIPIIVCGSQLVLKALERFPAIITFGAALLGWIGGGLIVSDVIFKKYFNLDIGSAIFNFLGMQFNYITLLAEVLGAIIVYIIAKIMHKMNTK